MNYRSTLLTAGAAVALAGLTNAQVNNDIDFNWANLTGGPAAVLFDPAFFGGTIGLGDSIRLCYSVDITQGGRNETGSTYVSWFNIAQAWGGNNTQPGVDIGPVLITSQVSDDLGDDSCLSGLFTQTGTIQPGGDTFAFTPGLIAGTGSASINQGSFWNIVFEFTGSNLPAFANTAGVDPSNPFGAPFLTHLIYEVQGPVNEGDTNKQYFLGSTSEKNGINPAGTGGVTNGATGFGQNAYGATADISGAVAHTRVTIQNAGTIQGGPVFLTTSGDLEALGAVAFGQPYLSGVNGANTGGGNADWVVTGGSLSTIDIRVLDVLSGAENPSSGAPVANPGLFFNNGFVLFSGTPAITMAQLPLSWDDLGGSLPPKAGTYVLPPQATTRAGSQTIHVNFDGTTSAFLNLGINVLGTFQNATDADVFDLGQGSGIAGTSQLQAPIPLSTPAPGAGGARIGLHALGLQVDVLTGGALTVSELSTAKTAVLQ